MKKIQFWRFMIMILVAIFGVFFIPFFTFGLGYNGTLLYSFGTTNFNLLTPYLIALTVIYSITGLLANGLKEKGAKVFGVFNSLSAFSLIILLSFYAFYNSSLIIPTISFVAIDIVLAIVRVSVNFNGAKVVKQSNPQPQQTVSTDDGSINLNTVELRDATELKLKIQNMQMGLNKSYDEAIDEIEKTGALNGMEIGQIISDYDEPPKIIPEVVEPSFISEQPNQSVQNQVNDELEYYRPRRDDPLAQISNNSDYQNIHADPSQVDESKVGGYKYLSRRINDERDSH